MAEREDEDLPEVADRDDVLEAVDGSWTGVDAWRVDDWVMEVIKAERLPARDAVAAFVAVPGVELSVERGIEDEADVRLERTLCVELPTTVTFVAGTAAGAAVLADTSDPSKMLNLELPPHIPLSPPHL